MNTENDMNPEELAVINKIKLQQPDSRFDASFSSDLRARLMHRKNIVSPFFTFNRYAYSLVASLLAIILVVPLTSYITLRSVSNGTDILEQVKNLTSSLSPQQKIQDKGSKAFGTLALLPKTTAKMTGDSAPSTTSAMMAAGLAVTGDMATATIEVAPEIVKEVKLYSYAGADLILDKSYGNIYRRGTGFDAGRNLLNLIEKSDFGMVSLASFPNMSVKDIELAQDITTGYRVNVNFDQGVVTIRPDPAKWPAMNTQASTTKKNLTPAAIIAVSDTFLKEHKISHASYSSPEVVPDSDTTTVIYPLVIDGLSVYTANGKKYGMEVTVDATNKRITALQNLTSQTYDSAQYDLAKNSAIVLDGIATSMNQDFTNIYTATSSEAQVVYDTPSKVLMRIIRTTDIGVKEELFVPALLFPNKDPKGQSAVVPLVLDFLTR